MTKPAASLATVASTFDSRSNSIGFLRWLMAFLVIFSHAGPIGGFYGGEDLGTQLSSEQSLGGVAVAGFFFFSGFLITRSRMGRSGIIRYFWRRCLRIFPAFWAALIITVVILAPIAAWHTYGSLDPYIHPAKESPFSYFANNMFLELNQRNIAGMGSQLPYAQLHNGYDWNGSAWTLKWEFLAYIIVGLLGTMSALRHRIVGIAFALTMIALNALQWTGSVNMSAISPVFSNPFFLMFLAPFAFGMLFTLAGEYIPVDSKLAIGSLIIAFATYCTGGWNIWGQYFFLYFLMWLAIRLPLQRWEKHGDFSYGIYIYAWPLMTFGAYFGLQNYGWIVYHVTIVVACHIFAYISWHTIEKPAMSLKNWNPPFAKHFEGRRRRASEGSAA